MNIIILSLCIVVLSLVIGYIMTTSYNIKHENSNKVETMIRSPYFFGKSVDLTKICKKDRISLNL